MLELDACTRCQECISVCPMVRTGFPDSAMECIAGWRKIITRFSRLNAWLGRGISTSPNHSNLFSCLYHCTTCGACSVVCESGIDIPALIESMRGAGREMGYRDAVVERTAKTIVKKKNPYDMAPETRRAWIPAGIPIAELALIGLFVGCTIAFREQEVGRAALRILALSKTEFCMLENRESCCGSFLFRTGSYKEYQDVILTMIQDLVERGVETLLVLCRMLKNNNYRLAPCVWSTSAL